jgi:uncharacterized membrane protein YeaQ/YmgE (transglycosylase-associated protein family)
LGLVAGFVASILVERRGSGQLPDILIGAVGAVIGGAAFNLMGETGITGFNLASLVVAVLGAILALFSYHNLLRHPGVRAR